MPVLSQRVSGGVCQRAQPRLPEMRARGAEQKCWSERYRKRVMSRTAPKTAWTNERLRRLYRRYNRRFWGGKLPDFSIRLGTVGKLFGQCDGKKKVITINVGLHPSDREIRSTILHEMCHAAADGGKRPQGHGYPFWAQIEHLLRQRAPITVGFPETPGLTILANAVPRRFPLARRAMARVERQRAHAVERYARTHQLTTHKVGVKEILGYFEEAVTVEGLNWRQSLRAIGTECGLIDVGGNSTSEWAAGVIAQTRKAYRRQRRDFLEGEMVSTMVNCWEGDQAPLLELYRKLGKAKAEALQTRIEAQWKAARATRDRAVESEAPAGKNCAE